jgi:hypothetical protein
MSSNINSMSTRRHSSNLFSIAEKKNGMGWRSDLERGDDSDGDGAGQPDAAVPRGARRDVVACGALPAAAPEEPEPAEPEPSGAAAGPEPSAATPPPKRVASEEMKAALLRARTAKAEKRQQGCHATILVPQYFFDIV